MVDFSDVLHGLFMATYQPGKGTHIWQFDGEIPRPIAYRKGKVGNLQCTGDELFDATEHEIRRTRDGNRIAYRNPHILALSSQDGKLIDSGMDGIIRETETGKELHRSEAKVTALLGGKRLIYAIAQTIWPDTWVANEALTKAQICALGQKTPLCARDYEVAALCEHEGKYYDAIDAGFIGRIGTSLVTPFAVRSGKVTSLIVHNGIILDSEFIVSAGTRASRIIRTTCSHIVYQSPHEITALATPAPTAQSR